MRAASRRAIEIDRCLIAAPELSAAIPHLRRLVRALRTPVTAIDVATRGGFPGVVLVLHATAPPGHRDRAVAERFVVETPGVTGVVLAGGGAVRTFGETRVRIDAGAGRTVEVSPLAFLQSNAAANALLVGAVVAHVDPQPEERGLELHAGAGNFTFALAPRVAALHAVERDRYGALALARAARRIPGLTVERAAARSALERCVAAAGARFDWILADPPRTGLRTELAGLLALAPAADRLRVLRPRHPGPGRTPPPRRRLHAPPPGARGSLSPDPPHGARGPLRNSRLTAGDACGRIAPNAPPRIFADCKLRYSLRAFIPICVANAAMRSAGPFPWPPEHLDPHPLEVIR